MNLKSLSLWAFITVLTTFFSCKETLPPTPYGAVPTPYQMEWQKMEYNMFIHFGPNTFTDVEWGDGKEDPKVFNPTGLDCRQWAATAKAAGMKGIIITAKHHDGFCLWPSRYSSHTVRESLWKDGKGDVLKELSEACKEYGLKFGVYLSPWDQNHPSYGTPEYNEIFASTLSEVLSGYGEVFEQWFDGANGEGENGKKQVYDWELFNSTVYRHQPHAIIFSDVGPGCRWMGNERGYAGETNWSRLNIEGFEPGKNSPETNILNTGDIYGKAWVPAETDTSIRPGWFYSPSTDDKVKSLEQLIDIYYSSIGRNSTLLLNIPPNRTGRIHPNDSTRLMELRKALDESFKNNLAKGKIIASSIRGNDKIYAAENLLNGQYDSYWATDDSITTASVELDMENINTFNRIVLQEYIPLGQRVAAFNVEYWDADSNTWHLLAEATTIGYKRILRFPKVTTQRIRLNITNSLACPVLNNLEIYNAPHFDSTTDNNVVTNALPAKSWKVLSPIQPDADKIIDLKADMPVSVSISEPIILELDKTIPLGGFFYIPQDEVTASNIFRYNLYCSKDGKSWKQLKTNELFNNIKNNPIRQDVLFEKEVKVYAKYLKIEPVELTNKSDRYAVVEFGIIE